MIYAFFAFLAASIILIINIDEIDSGDHWEYSIITAACALITIAFGLACIN